MTQFDPTKVIYIGTADTGVRVCATFQNSKINTFAAAQKNKTILGASSAGGATRDYAFLHNHTPEPCSMWLRATRARSTSRLRWNAAKSTAVAAGTGRA